MITITITIIIIINTIMNIKDSTKDESKQNLTFRNKQNQNCDFRPFRNKIIEMKRREKKKKQNILLDN